MKKNGNTWSRNKGCFGGSLPNHRKFILNHYRPIIATVKTNGTVGCKLVYKYYKGNS